MKIIRIILLATCLMANVLNIAAVRQTARRSDNEILSPLMCAVITGNNDDVFRCLNNRENIDTQDRNGDTALHCAYMFSNQSIIDALLRSWANRRIINNDGQIPSAMRRVESI